MEVVPVRLCQEIQFLYALIHASRRELVQHVTSGTAFESHPAVTPAEDILFSSTEVRTGVWMLPLNAKGSVACHAFMISSMPS